MNKKVQTARNILIKCQQKTNSPLEVEEMLRSQINKLCERIHVLQIAHLVSYELAVADVRKHKPSEEPKVTNIQKHLLQANA